MEHEVAAGFLAEEAGVPVRTIQFWTDAGVLEAIPESDRQGRGRHRAYKAAPPLYGERACALIAAEMHRLRLPVGVMKGITFMLRWKKDGKLEPNFVTAVALRGEPMSILISPGEPSPENPDGLVYYCLVELFLRKLVLDTF